MRWDLRPLAWHRVPASASIKSTNQREFKPLAERLESRELLALFTGFSHVRHIPTRTGVFSLSVDGPGVLKTSPAGKGSFDVRVLGTTTESTLTISQVRSRFHLTGGPLQIRNLSIGSAQIGNIEASSAVLNGSMTPLESSPESIAFGGLGRKAQIDVLGSVGTMDFGSVDLGPVGHVIVGVDLVGASTTETDTGEPAPALTIGQLHIDAGKFVIGRDALAPISIAGDLSLSHNGVFSTGRDQAGTLTVGGSILLDTGGEVLVGRNLSGMLVNGDLQVAQTQSGILVGGNLGPTRINGKFQGKGSATSVDLAVGLNLNGLHVLGGGANQGSIQDANINVGKNLTGLDAAHGIFRSWITAGVAIDGVRVGADGVIAINNSEIDAGTSITNVTLEGDVKSGWPTGDRTGYRTRIIAGKVRGPGSNSTPDDGLYLPNGTIKDFTIQGALIDAVLAASVAPFGGDGSLPPDPTYGSTPRACGTPPGVFTNFQAPAGLTNGTTPNFSIRNVGGPSADEAAWAVPEGQRHACVLENGSIIVSVIGGVVSSQPDQSSDTEDYAGIFAVNTTGVSQ